MATHKYYYVHVLYTNSIYGIAFWIGNLGPDRDHLISNVCLNYYNFNFLFLINTDSPCEMATLAQSECLVVWSQNRCIIQWI